VRHAQVIGLASTWPAGGVTGTVLVAAIGAVVRVGGCAVGVCVAGGVCVPVV